MDQRIQQVNQSIMDGDEQKTSALCRKLMEAGVPAEDIVQDGMIPAMNELGALLARRQKFVPQIIMSTRAMQSGLRVVSPGLGKHTVLPINDSVIIGTVQGDIHSLGKILASTMLKSAGFKVVDLGTNVEPERFVRAVRDNDSKVVCLSAMLTTTMPSMRSTIRALKSMDVGGKDGVHIIVGGAPVNDRFAKDLGVEYASNAVETMNRALMICGHTPIKKEK